MHHPLASPASHSRQLLRPEGKEPGRFILQPSGCAGDGLHGTQAGRWVMRCCFSIKHLQNQQMSSAVMSVSPPPPAQREMKGFPSEPQPPAWPQLPREDASHKLGLSLCWGSGGRSVAALGRAEGPAEHITGMTAQPWSSLVTSRHAPVWSGQQGLARSSPNRSQPATWTSLRCYPAFFSSFHIQIPACPSFSAFWDFLFYFSSRLL